jgi:predicted phage terminase large subunit-like protein
MPALAKVEQSIRRARIDVATFVAGGFRDHQGHILDMAPVHFELQEFLSRHPMALVELPRDHGKSTQVCARLVWELGRQPGLRVKIVCATETLAIERARFLRDALDHNPWVRAVFPHLAKRVPWRAEAFTLVRPGTVIGPSVSAVGVNGGSTGSRADLLVCDDIVDVASLASAAERDRVAMIFRENLLNLLEPHGRCWCLFTTWHPDDLNANLKTNPAFATFRHAVGPNLEPVWPGKWPTERLAERQRQIGARSFARGYQLIATSETDFTIPKASITYWEPVPPPFETILLAVDPAVSTRDTADRSALVVLGKAEGTVYGLDALAGRWTAPELARAIGAMDRRWKPDRIVFETNAAFLGVKDLLARGEPYGHKLTSQTHHTSKESRFQALAVLFHNGRVKLQRGPAGPAPAQHELWEELTTIPHARHDDLADALALGAEFLFRTKSPQAHTLGGTP